MTKRNVSILHCLAFFGISGLLAPSVKAQKTGLSIVESHDPSNTVGTYSAVHTNRPLAEILMRMQLAFLTPINYEEVAYESPKELKSMQLETMYGTRTKFFTPTSDFSMTLTNAESTPYLAVHSSLAQYKNAGLHGANDYQVIQQANRIDILPNQVLGANGSSHNVTPVMSFPISFPLTERTVERTLGLIAESVSKASGKRVSVIGEPFNDVDKVTLGANAELPGDVLAKLAATIGTVLSYQRLYEDDGYYIAFYPVTAPVIGNLVNNRTPGQAKAAPPIHFFTKDLP